MNATSNQGPRNYLKRKASEEPLNLECKPQPITPEMINAMIEENIKNEVALYKAQEDAFVEQCLQQNPVECRSRPSVRADPATTDPAKLKRNEACRKSRLNAKIKKAKTKYQKMFLLQRMEQRAAQLQQWRAIIANAETNLLQNGFSAQMLLGMRSLAGMERVKYHDLSMFGAKPDDANGAMKFS